MTTKQTIVIIGATDAGRQVAALLAGGNYNLLLCDEEFAKSESLASELNKTVKGCQAEAMQCSFDCAWEGDIVLMAVNAPEQKVVAEIIREVVNQKIVISLISAMKQVSDGIASALCQCDELQKMLPNSKLVSVVFNNSLTNTTVYVTGKDVAAAESVLNMFRAAGVDAVLAEQLAANVAGATPGDNFS